MKLWNLPSTPRLLVLHYPTSPIEWASVSVSRYMLTNEKKQSLQDKRSHDRQSFLCNVKSFSSSSQFIDSIMSITIHNSLTINFFFHHHHHRQQRRPCRVFCSASHGRSPSSHNFTLIFFASPHRSSILLSHDCNKNTNFSRSTSQHLVVNGERSRTEQRNRNHFSRIIFPLANITFALSFYATNISAAAIIVMTTM